MRRRGSCGGCSWVERRIGLAWLPVWCRGASTCPVCPCGPWVSCLCAGCLWGCGGVGGLWKARGARGPGRVPCRPCVGGGVWWRTVGSWGSSPGSVPPVPGGACVVRVPVLVRRGLLFENCIVDASILRCRRGVSFRGCAGGGAVVQFLLFVSWSQALPPWCGGVWALFLGSLFCARVGARFSRAYGGCLGIGSR